METSTSSSAADASAAAASHKLQFDHDATPEEKMRQAMKDVPAGHKTERRNKGTELVTEAAAAAAPKVEDLPPPTTQATKTGTSSAQALALQKGNKSVVGWQQAGGATSSDFWNVDRADIDGKVDPDNVNGRDLRTLLEDYLPPGTYGDWFHNAGVIGATALSCWVVGRLGGGLAWIVVIGAILGTYYRTSIRRTRRNARDDLTRLLAKRKLEHDYESAEWMNSFLTKFWVIFEPELSAMIVGTVDQVLATSTPAFLESLRLDEFTLGTQPPRIEHVKTYPKSEDDVVIMDWKFAFTPNDVQDLTMRQVKNKVNPRIVLGIRVGKSVATANIPIVVEDIACAGLMQVRIKLMSEFPNIKIVDLSFLEKPVIDYVLKPIGGKTLGFDVGFIPGLSGAILSIIHGTLGPMMYAPNVFSLNVQQMLSGAPIDSAIGVAVVTIHSAAGVKNPDTLGGKPDPYVKLSLAGHEVARTTTIKSTNEPQFNEVKTVLITTLTDPLILEVLDFNEIRADRVMGAVSFDLHELENDPEVDHVSMDVMNNAKPRGNLNFSISWYPVLQAPKNPDGTPGPTPESSSGIVRFTVHQAKNIAGGKNISAFASLLLNAKEVAKTPKMKNTHNPVWDFSKEMLVTDKDKCVLGVQLRHDDDRLGSMQIKLLDLLKNTEDEVDEYALQNTREVNGKIKLSATWKPVALGSLGSSAAYETPIGALRIHLHAANDLKDLDVVGKPDPYVSVLVNGKRSGRTVTVKNEFNPVWNEIVYVAVRNPRERIKLECMDYQQRTKDRSLGTIDVDLSQLVRQNPAGYYEECDDRTPRTAMFKLGNGQSKGTLKYSISFHPALSVYTTEEEEKLDKEAAERTTNPVLASPVSAARTSFDNKAAANPAVDQLIQQAAPRHKRSESVLTTSTTSRARALAPPKMRLAAADLGKYQSGFLVVDLLEGDFAHSGAYLQVFLDDYLYSSYSSAKVRSRHVQWNNETMDVFVRELDLSQIQLRVNESHENTSDAETLGEAADSTLSILKRSFNTPITIALPGKHGASKLTFKSRWIPVPLQLDARESVNNMGSLRFDLVKATDLIGMDRGGKSSDPYAKFVLNGETVFTSQTIKKTLNPQWNESFEVAVPSRVDADFVINVFDWDLGGGDDPLGSARIPLEALEPLTSMPIELKLEGVKSGVVHGRMLFRPAFVTRARRGTTSRTMTLATGVAGAPIKAGTKVVGGALHGAKRTGSLVGRGLFGRSSHKAAHEDALAEDQPQIAVGPDGTTYTHDPAINLAGIEGTASTSTPISSRVAAAIDSPANQSSSFLDTDPNSSVGGGTGELGTLSITFGSPVGFPDLSHKVSIKVKGTKFSDKTDAHKHMSSFTNTTLRGIAELGETLQITLRESSLLGSDKTLGRATLQIPYTQSALSSDNHTISFDGTFSGSSLPVTLGFKPLDAASTRTATRRSLFGSGSGSGGGSASVTPSRKSLG
ncbi:Tricalbin-2 [Savitreella phatthalungensis]